MEAKVRKCPQCGAAKGLYQSRRFALSVALRSFRQTGMIRIYNCPKGPGFHLTTKRYKWWRD